MVRRRCGSGTSVQLFPQKRLLPYSPIMKNLAVRLHSCRKYQRASDLQALFTGISHSKSSIGPTPASWAAMEGPRLGVAKEVDSAVMSSLLEK